MEHVPAGPSELALADAESVLAHAARQQMLAGLSPYTLDPACVLYLASVLQEAQGRRKFGYSTALLTGERAGPMLRALMAALNVQIAEERRQQIIFDCLQPVGIADIPPPPTREGVRRIVYLANTPAFRKWADIFHLPPTSAAVAENPAQFRHLVALLGRERKPRVPD